MSLKKNICLCDLDLCKKGKVIKIYNTASIKRRLLDMGFTKNTIVESVLKNFGDNLRAYMIRGTLIAIRNDDAKSIIVEEY